MAQQPKMIRIGKGRPKKTKITLSPTYNPPGKSTPNEVLAYISNPERKLLTLLGGAGKEVEDGIRTYYMEGDGEGGPVSGVGLGGGSYSGTSSSSGTGARGPTSPGGTPSRTGSNQPAGSSSTSGVSGGRPGGPSSTGGGGASNRGPTGPQGQNSGFNQGGGQGNRSGSTNSGGGQNMGTRGGAQNAGQNAGSGPRGTTGPQGQSQGDRPLGGVSTKDVAKAVSGAMGGLLGSPEIGGKYPGAKTPQKEYNDRIPEEDTPFNQDRVPGQYTPGSPNDVMRAIQNAEGTLLGMDSPYDTTLGYGKWATPEQAPSTMTLGQWNDLGDDMRLAQKLAGVPAGKRSSALGANQIVNRTANDFADRMGLSDDTVMSPSVQDEMARQIALSEQGVGAWASLANKRTASGLTPRGDEIQAAIDSGALNQSPYPSGPGKNQLNNPISGPAMGPAPTAPGTVQQAPARPSLGPVGLGPLGARPSLGPVGLGPIGSPAGYPGRGYGMPQGPEPKMQDRIAPTDKIADRLPQEQDPFPSMPDIPSDMRRARSMTPPSPSAVAMGMEGLTNPPVPASGMPPSQGELLNNFASQRHQVTPFSGTEVHQEAVNFTEDSDVAPPTSPQTVPAAKAIEDVLAMYATPKPSAINNRQHQGRLSASYNRAAANQNEEVEQDAPTNVIPDRPDIENVAPYNDFGDYGPVRLVDWENTRNLLLGQDARDRPKRRVMRYNNGGYYA